MSANHTAIVDHQPEVVVEHGWNGGLAAPGKANTRPTRSAANTRRLERHAAKCDPRTPESPDRYAWRNRRVGAISSDYPAGSGAMLNPAGSCRLRSRGRGHNRPPEKDGSRLRRRSRGLLSAPGDVLSGSREHDRQSVGPCSRSKRGLVAKDGDARVRAQ